VSGILCTQDYITVPDSKSRNVPKVVVVRRWAVGFWDVGGEGWVG
jgi:hypothetical protein